MVIAGATSGTTGKEPPMSSNTMEVGRRLVELCRQGKAKEAIDALYSPDVVSIEAQSVGGRPARTEGIAAVGGRNEWWEQNHEIHHARADGPWPHGDRFIVHFNYEVTPRVGPMAGRRMTIDEAALYTVKDGKIVRVEFFYHMGG
jgi:ketosteroid isomerase-like protein